MSEVPIGWTPVSLSQVVRLENGDRSKNYPSRRHRVSSGVPFINAGHLKDGRVSQESMDYISKERFDMLSSGKTRDGDVLFCLRGSLGKTALVNDITEGAIASSLVIVRPFAGLSSKYLYYYLSSPLAKSEIARFDNGTAQPNLAAKDLGKFVLPLAPAEEQKRIVAAVEEQFSRLDAGVAALQRAQSELQPFRRSVVAGALAGTWTATVPFIADAAEIIKAKEAARTTVRRKARTIVPQRGKPLPDGWTWATIDQVAANRPHAIKAGPFGSALKKEYYVDHGYKIYGQEQVIRGDPSYGDYYISEEKYQSLASCAIRPRDLLISLVGTIGKTLILGQDCEPGIINPRLIKISLDEEIMSPEFLSVVLKSPAIRAKLKLESHGETMDVINLGMLRRVPVPCPPPEHQAVIVDRLAVQSDLIGYFNSAIESTQRHATALRYSILNAAFSGRLVPQNFSEEPASRLLERIIAEGKSPNDRNRSRTRKPPTRRKEVTA